MLWLFRSVNAKCSQIPLLYAATLFNGDRTVVTRNQAKNIFVIVITTK